MSQHIYRIFNRARLDDRQVNELLGLAHGIIADDRVDKQEARFLQKWLAANVHVNANPVVCKLLERVNEMLADSCLDEDEAEELLDTLKRFSGGDFELGEILKSTTLPLDQPPPELRFSGFRYCFTGTFAFGSRSDCKNAVTDLGASHGPLTKKTDYLVIGIYATESWAHSSYGRKIEKAMEMKNMGHPISIVGEEHWVSYIAEAT